MIEVADSSLAFDRKEILPRYAHAAIPEVWVVNIPEQCIQQYIDPHQGKYRFTKVIFANEAVMCERLGVIVNVADVFEGF